MFTLNCKGKLLVLDSPVIMGIINATPDSFYQGNINDDMLLLAKKMIADGATILDIGGQSTRPGSKRIAADEELARVIPVIELIHQHFPGTVISIDTYKPEVMEEVIKCNIDIINDVRALRERDNLRDGLNILAAANIPVILMHMQGNPATMQHNPQYTDIFSEISGFFRQRIQACLEAGIAHERIVLDPGFGFGKTLPHNVALLKGLSRFESLGLPLLVGLSRKSMLGTILGGAAVDQRLYAGVAGAVIAALNGARILRVHDVKPTIDALAVVTAFQEQGI